MSGIYWKCDNCGECAGDAERERLGTKYRHLPCGGKWVLVDLPYLSPSAPHKASPTTQDKE